MLFGNYYQLYSLCVISFLCFLRRCAEHGSELVTGNRPISVHRLPRRALTLCHNSVWAFHLGDIPESAYCCGGVVVSVSAAA